jgi:ATP-dependent DNA helicase RecG
VPERRVKPAARPAGGATAKGSIAEKLAQLGLIRHDDLLLHLPLRYEDETRILPIAEAIPQADAVTGSVQVAGEVTECQVLFRPRRQLVAQIRDDSGVLVVRFLHFHPFQQTLLQSGKRLRFAGEIRMGHYGAEMVHPRVQPLGDEGTPEASLPQTLTPVYPTTAGLSQMVLRKRIAAARVEAGTLADTLPADWLAARHLPDFQSALDFLHHPPADAPQAALADRSHPAWRRMKLDELLAQQISLRRAYRARRALGAPPLAGTGILSARLCAALPFALTAAQERAVAEIGRDLAQEHPMQRLLQGDVGAGKTLVAALAACQAIESGWQAVFMAPTEILAEQHAQKLRDWFLPLGVEIAFLSGSQGAKARRVQLAAARTAGLVIGTHALIQEGVDFDRLGLAIIDEQHRFGVRQRLALRQKGTMPHQLMMSATPIPRSLAMTHYADLDVSVLDELPPGRAPVRTRLARQERREEVMAWIRREVAAGRQVYWVCPLIEESEVLELQTALETYAWLREALPECTVGLAHGRLKAAEKQAVMADFAAGKIALLVATTVLEVGVDVPNASLMVIEHAERFGLAQLHQLRGRVGRGAAQSACVLLYAEPLSATARARLKILYENSDGFEIARLDLALRGPGEFVGSRQSGLPLLRYADLETDIDLVELARDWAARLLAEAPDAAERHLARWLGGREELLKA